MMKGLKPFVKFYYTGRTEDKGIFKMSVYTHSYVCNISKKLNKLLKLHPTPHSIQKFTTEMLQVERARKRESVKYFLNQTSHFSIMVDYRNHFPFLHRAQEV